MWTRELALSLNPKGGIPVFLQIARAVADDVRRGRLRPGDPLPGSRSLAQTLKVHRNTVLAAYRELEAEGWLSTSPAKGTFISTALPEPSPRPFGPGAVPRARMPDGAGFDLTPGPESYQAPAFPRGTLALSGGIPDVRLVPVAALARAYRRALRSHGRTVLDYGDSRGHPTLRAALAQMLSQVRGLAASPETVVVTRGSQMGLDLVARTLLSPGDVVAVEELGYRPAWEALRAAGAKLVPIPVDAMGIQTEAIEALAAKRKVRAIYVTPHHQYPTTVVLAAGRRLRLLELAAARRIAVIEDDYDHEFHYEGRPVLPLASSDQAGVVIYVGTLSKILAPGLRIGFVVAPAPFLEGLVARRTYVDRQGDLAIEAAVAELLEDGEVQRHARRARRVYQARRDALAEALQAQLGSAVSFELPPGGMALWGKLESGLDADALAAVALEHKVGLHPASRFDFHGRASPYLRLGYAALGEGDIREAVRRLAGALQALRNQRRRAG